MSTDTNNRTADRTLKGQRQCECGDLMQFRWHLSTWGQAPQWECDGCGRTR